MRFVYDDKGGLDIAGVRSSGSEQPIEGWWGNPTLKLPPTPRVVESSNSEVVLHYADGRQTIESLVPPFNLDCYFQHFSRKGTPIPFGTLGPAGFIHAGMMSAHADVLEIACDSTQELESVEIRATCSEGVIGVGGMTAPAARE